MGPGMFLLPGAPALVQGRSAHVTHRETRALDEYHDSENSMPGNGFQHFGFTALVTRLSRTTNLTELIPILIKAIQEQQQD
jgi:hypothetical protein